ncbi:phasin family protein [Massilia litorea]|uniref:Phasin family protein n=1 Tax=Massilia litorea TaxID=2769491 RepID=A0A7L9U504_9BURK|nr:phasin family protein [Massilia litorea]QOL49372.1 phasin family protein [Massilia litorea]
MPAFSPSLPDLRSQLGAQVDFLSQVSHHAIDTARQLSELNVRAARQLVDDGVRLGRALASCDDPFQIGTVAMREASSTAEDWQSWQNSLMGVLSAGTATFAHDANDGSWQAARSVTAGAAAEDVGAAHNPT